MTNASGQAGIEPQVFPARFDAATQGKDRLGMEILSVISEQSGRAAHLRLSGEIDMTSVPILERWLEAAESNGNTEVVVDLDAVTFMDASGIRTFLGAAHRATQSGNTFTIIKAPAPVQRILRITGTEHLLHGGTLPSPAQPLGEHTRLRARSSDRGPASSFACMQSVQPAS